jgi:hypothetical protein
MSIYTIYFTVSFIGSGGAASMLLLFLGPYLPIYPFTHLSPTFLWSLFFDLVSRSAVIFFLFLDSWFVNSLSPART